MASHDVGSMPVLSYGAIVEGSTPGAAIQLGNPITERWVVDIRPSENETRHGLQHEEDEEYRNHRARDGVVT